MSVTAGVSDTIITIRDKLRGKIGKQKLKGIGLVELLNGQMMPMKMGISCRWIGWLPWNKHSRVRKTRIFLRRMMLGSAVWQRVG